MGSQAKAIVGMNDHDRDTLAKELRDIVVNEHSLKRCITEIVDHMHT
jgi:hypothetical protein